MRALAMVAEVVHGAPCRFSDPARFSLAHGGKDGHPFPVPLRVYDETIRVLKSAVQNARLGREEELGALQRLDQQARRVESWAKGPNFEDVIAEEYRQSASYGGRTVFGWAKASTSETSSIQAYADSGENDKLKQWAQTTLPTLKEHLKEAQALDAAVGQTPVVAQDSQTGSDERAKTTDQTTSDKDAKKATDTPPSKIKYVTRQAPTDWSAEALIGRTVENTKGENLGDINNVVLNEKGDVVAVTIGVGGFLGLGEKDVGVPFDALEFRTEKDITEQSTDTKAKESKEEQSGGSP